jgi:hypothetical protein
MVTPRKVMNVHDGRRLYAEVAPGRVDLVEVNDVSPLRRFANQCAGTSAQLPAGAEKHVAQG